ncbi:GlcF1 [Desulfosarcina cetonica]|uniref:(Fe-S)-binding protein n=1 Tax=Desulfosarcina cetonica TaxID=90730 RepID=UPI0006D118D9|nr:(Fe-S)-binding protein [Desulfosarcina cetonica]VTR67085.1 GlcF1 [Desulfosarcina cetonica]
MKADEAYQCGKCGLCLSACPVYRVMREETTTPRAKVHLIRSFAENRLPATDRMQAKLQCCLMCGTCTAMCPGGVSHDTLFMRMRSQMAIDRGQSKEVKALGAILPKENRLRMAAKAARIGTSSLAQRIIGKMRIGNIPMENFPTPNRTPFRDQVPEVIEPEGKVVGTVAYFTGCATHHIFEQTGHAVVKVLRRMGYRILLPADQGCCGLPLFFHGEIRRARENILTNIRSLSAHDCDAVLTDCATCGSALGHMYPRLMAELDLPAGDADALAATVMDAGEFVATHMDLLTPHLSPAATRETVTYHLPCHLKNHGSGKTLLESLLTHLPHADYHRTPDWDACCGGGGFFFNEYPDIAKRMVDGKIANALASGARTWATGCPGCRVQLAGNLPRKGVIEVCHPLEVVARGLR